MGECAIVSQTGMLLALPRAAVGGEEMHVSQNPNWLPNSQHPWSYNGVMSQLRRWYNAWGQVNWVDEDATSHRGPDE
jgi:hypothetical protein